ncbi:MAG TPA: hypothetical protein VGN12_24650 [Pirellulales bacterium]
MATPNIRCTIVEVGGDHEMTDRSQTSRELLPWADPFIAQLVERYRLRAALDDSLHFLRSESHHESWRHDRPTEGRLPQAPRFKSLFDDRSDMPFSG